MIENGKKVTVNYKLTVHGEVVDSSEQNGPLTYVHGTGQIIKGLEKVLTGLKQGDTTEVTIGPDDAYGARDPKAIIQIAREKINSEELDIGMGIQATDPSGKQLEGIVTDIKEDQVTIDFNHPLAGQELFFEVEVLEIAAP